MISRFPAPWRIVELPNGFAVEDATGKQIGVFYGRAPDGAGHTGIVTMDEACARWQSISQSCRNCSSGTDRRATLRPLNLLTLRPTPPACRKTARTARIQALPSSGRDGLPRKLPTKPRRPHGKTR